MLRNRSITLFFRSNIILIVALVLLLVFYLFEFFIASNNSPEKLVSKFQAQLIKEIVHHETSYELLTEKISPTSDLNWKELDLILKVEKLHAYIYYHDSLIYWNTQIGEFLNEEIISCKSDTIILRNNEWYLVSFYSCDSIKITLYTDQETFLPFTTSISLPAYHLTENLSSANLIIKDASGNDLIGLNFELNDVVGLSEFLILLIIYFAFFTCLVIWVFQFYNQFKPLKYNELTVYILFISDVIILRLLDYLLVFPTIIKQSFYYADSATNIYLFTSIGDVLLNGLLIVVVLVISLLNFPFHKIQNLGQKHKTLMKVVSSFLLVFISYFLLFLISKSINVLSYDSLTGLSINNIYGVFIFAIIVLYLTSLFLFFKVFEKLFYLFQTSVNKTIVLIGAISILFYISGLLDLEILILSSILIILILIVFKFIKEGQSISLIKHLLYLIIFATITSVVINIDSRTKRDEHQILSARLLSKESDAELEEIYNEAYLKIIDDTILGNLIQSPNNELLALNYLKSKYFKNIKDKFTIQMMVCSQGELINIQPEGFITECSTYFDGLILNSDKMSVDSSLYLINNETESIYYISKLVPKSNAQYFGENIVYLEFFSSIVPEGFGYTELLVDQKSNPVDLTGYSFAWYQNNQLVYKFGNFPFETDYKFFEKFENEKFFEVLGYRTLKININTEKYFIISRPSQLFTEQIVTFSLLFLAFGIVVSFVFLLVYRLRAITIFTLNFRIRLQFFFIGTISLIIVLFAIITFYYLKDNNATMLKTELNEKTQSVIIELQHKLSADEYINNNNNENLYQLLRKFSMVFFSDINLYDLSGKLIATSRPEIFTRGLQSTRMNPEAYRQLGIENQLYFLTEENLGEVSYFSSYAPLVMSENQLVGFVNLPYFARQFDVEKSYLFLFSTFINLFVILGIIGTLLALLLSRILIKPLAVLQENLAAIQIDRPNSKIEWNIDDEIGLLIREYNKMIDKLEQSTILLKHSERETAWREVAKQIAHEIKNPLTPMKLNVQYMEKAYLEDDPKFKEKIRNISASLVMQIDTLDKVAEMFSEFAKTKTGNFEHVDLLKTINSSVSLFRNNFNINFEVLAEDNNADFSVLAYEKDILRVFNNLIKNSIQSIEGRPSGKIEIVFISDVNHIIVEVIDDGKGMTDAAKSKIFQPYFTTKTGGTGLGLAIVKNIMSEIGGEITFESSIEKGTKFILRFNRIKPKTE